MTERSTPHIIGEEEILHGEMFAVRSPFSGHTVAHAYEPDPSTVDKALALAERVRPTLGWMPRHERARRLGSLADLLRRDAAYLAELLIEEVGKPRRDAEVEVDRAQDVLRLTASAVLQGTGRVTPMDVTTAGEDRLGFEVQVPAGVVVAIAPFNAPLNLAVSKVAAALGAACPVIVKSPPQAPSPITHVARLALETGWPPGALSVVHGGVEPGRRLVSSPIPRVITFTGSVAGGLAISQEAGLKRLVLELGSNAPTIVCSDANVADAANRLLRGAFSSAGQACISTQRILVHREVVDELLADFIPAVDKMVVGDPADTVTDVGPVIDDRAVTRVRDWVQEAVQGGARLLSGSLPEASRLIRPILLADVPSDARLCHDEIFGPVAIVQSFGDDDEAVRIANGTPYGLQAGVFTQSLERALYYAENLDFGGIQINETSRTRLDHHGFGGRKDSGIGLEGVRHALESMTEVRFVGVRRHPTTNRNGRRS